VAKGIGTVEYTVNPAFGSCTSDPALTHAGLAQLCVRQDAVLTRGGLGEYQP